MPSYWFFLLLYPALFVAVLVHEAGHALMARATGRRVTSLGLGVGKPVFRLILPGGCILYACREHPTFGTCWTTAAELLPSRASRALLYLGGGGANLLIAALCFAAWRTLSGGVLLALFVVNLLVGIFNLLPRRHRMGEDTGKQNVASDGWQAVSLWASHRARIEPPESELGFCDLWDAVGDTQTRAYRLTLAALAAQDGGNPAQATEYLAQLGEATGDTLAHTYLVRGRLALANGNRDDATHHLSAARRGYHARGAVGSVFLCDLYALDTLPGADALAAWETLATSPITSRPEIATRLAGARVLLQARTDTGDAPMLETLLARYDAARRRFRDDATDLAVFATVAAWRDAHGDAGGAQLIRERIAA